jgi:NhaA family Na+:H+ antiporter
VVRDDVPSGVRLQHDDGSGALAMVDESGSEYPRDAERPHSWVESHRFVPTTFVQPVLRFLRQESAGGIVMLGAAVAALVVANTGLYDWYQSLFLTPIHIEFGTWDPFHHVDEMTLQLWVNDALMVGFFFLVGLEIKREVVVGELNDAKSAALPAIAALGGMLVPAGLYLLVNGVVFTEGVEPVGWGIPMATDIAFAVGIVAMLGTRVPVAAKLFLLALAIVDDLGAIAVIAIVYTDEIAVEWLFLAGGALLVIHVMNRIDVRSLTPYLIVGFVVWLAFLESGVHATIAGVLLAFMTPVKSFYEPRVYAETARPLIDKVDAYLPEDQALYEADQHTLERVASIIGDVNRLSRETLPPLTRIEQWLAPIASFLIVPVFAFANAGVRISGDAIAGATADPVLIGIAVGLFVGKTVGVTGASWLALRLRLGRMPRNTTWRHLIGLAMLAGIGFTVALFVAALAFEGPESAAQLDSAKIGIFAGSIVAGVGGFLFLRSGEEAADDVDPPAHADDEESSPTVAATA